MIIFILVTGIIVGLLPGVIGQGKPFSIINIAVGLAGAFTGALIGFGDAPLFLTYSFLNEKTLSVAVSILFVLIKCFVTGRKATP